MKKQLFILSILLSLPILFASCKKDKLTGVYDQFEGKYQWIYSRYSYRDCVLCTRKSHTDSASEASYTAQIEFDNTSCVTFYIDNEVLTKRKFRIKDQSDEGGSLFLDLKVDVKKSDLDIDDRLEVYTVSKDTIYLSGFPGSGYDKNFKGSNYFVRVK